MKKVSLLFALLCTFALGAFAQDGSWDNFRDTSWGTNYDEVESFTIENSAQLAQLAYMVNHPFGFSQCRMGLFVHPVRQYCQPKTITWLCIDNDWSGRPHDHLLFRGGIPW